MIEADGAASDPSASAWSADGSWPTAATRLVALLGWPGRYSRSPQIHNAAFRHMGLDLVYLALPCREDRLDVVVSTLRTVEAVGANVTVPHKQAVMSLVDRLTQEAQAVGAVNTLVIGADGVVGDNTDADGVADDWRRVLPAEVLAGRVVVLGTGGGARAAALAAARLGAQVTVVGRRVEAARQIASDMSPHATASVHAVDLADSSAVAATVGDGGLIVNATPVGMQGERLPEPFMALRAEQCAYDLIYEPTTTPFLAAARDAGASAHHGLGMLVGQAARAFSLWTGMAAPMEVMARAAEVPSRPSP